MRLEAILPLSRRARLAGSVIPRRFWFRLSLWMGDLHARVTRGPNGKTRRLQSWIMSEHWMSALTLQSGFDVPYRSKGIAACIPGALRTRGGTLFCVLHTPYFGILPRALGDLGCTLDAVIADPGNIRPEGIYLPLGCSTGPLAIPADDSALLKARTLLREGGLVAATLDAQIGGRISPALLQLAGRLGTRVVICWTELDPDDVICVTYEEPEWPVLDTPEKIHATILKMQAGRMRIFSALGVVENEIDNTSAPA